MINLAEIKTENLQDEVIKPKELTEQEKLEAKQKANAEKFAKFKGYNAESLKNNAEFAKLANEVINDALSNLPTAKFLEQEIDANVPNNNIYDEVIGKIFGEYVDIPAGQGKEFIISQAVPVGLLDKNNFIPPKRNDVDAYTLVDSVELNDEIKQVPLTASPWLYFRYFLSGKIDEYIAMVKQRAEQSIKLKQNMECFDKLKELYDIVNTDDATTKKPQPNKFAGTGSNLIEIKKELDKIIFDMKAHNTTFNTPANTQFYMNSNPADLVFITNMTVMANMKKVADTFYGDTSLKDWLNDSRWVVLPENIYDPAQKKLVPIALTLEKNFIFIVNKTQLKRIKNLQNAQSEFYPNNLTEVIWFNARYNQQYLYWLQTALYKNDNLVKDFALPVFNTNS